MTTRFWFYIIIKTVKSPPNTLTSYCWNGSQSLTLSQVRGSMKKVLGMAGILLQSVHTHSTRTRTRTDRQHTKGCEWPRTTCTCMSIHTHIHRRSFDWPESIYISKNTLDITRNHVFIFVSAILCSVGEFSGKGMRAIESKVQKYGTCHRTTQQEQQLKDESLLGNLLLS